MTHADRLLVAVIDDDANVRSAIALLLASQGWQPAVYAGARSFLADLAQGTRPGQVILVDLHMPEMTGADLLETLRGQHINLPAVVLSADPEGELAQRARRAGAQAILSKPFDPDALLHALAAAARQEPQAV